jgi:hypothetical protein
MTTPKPTTVAQYFASLPADRREALQAVRKVINDNIDTPFEEGLQYGMPAWFLPHSVYPSGYHCDRTQPLPFASIASQKNHMAIYLFCIYTQEGEEERFRSDWLESGRKLDMGKSCVRFKKLDDVALDVLAKAIRRATAKKFVASYEASLAGRKTPARKAAKKQTFKKTAKKTGATKKHTERAPAPKSQAPLRERKATTGKAKVAARKKKSAKKAARTGKK